MNTETQSNENIQENAINQGDDTRLLIEFLQSLLNEQNQNLGEIK